MKNILMRSGISPLDNFDAIHVMENNSIGGNVGNLIYAYSIYRALTSDEVTITPDYYDYDPKNADFINENYDCYVIPLADAFRKDFVPSLRKFTKLIKKLTIPVVVIGVGLRAPFEPKLNEGFDFDQDVKDFVNAVLEKSSMIGVRGQITADYLSRLGFKEGVDHTVIGCPSMYTFGRELNIKESVITKDSKISMNSSRLSPDNVLDFITRSLKEYPNHYFVPQWMKELQLAYVGTPALTDKEDSRYPVSLKDPIYTEDRVRFFLNVQTWFDLMKEVDFSFGARLHGNITATIAGTPSLLIPKDARMRELSEYHNLTHVYANEIDETTRLETLIENADFQSPTKVQARNFDHFIDFLDKNNLPHIYKEDINRKTAPLDEMIQSIDYNPAVRSILSCTTKEAVERFDHYNKMMMRKQNNLNKSLKSKTTTLQEKNKKIKHLESTLNRKSVSTVLKVADFVAKKK